MVSRTHTAIVAITCWLAASGIVPACCWPAPAASPNSEGPHIHHHVHDAGTTGAVPGATLAGASAADCSTRIDAVLQSGPNGPSWRAMPVCVLPDLPFGAVERVAAVVVLAPPGSGPPSSPPLIALRI